MRHQLFDILPPSGLANRILPGVRSDRPGLARIFSIRSTRYFDSLSFSLSPCSSRTFREERVKSLIRGEGGKEDDRRGWQRIGRNLTKHCSLEEQSLIYCNEFAGVKRYENACLLPPHLPTSPPSSSRSLSPARLTRY